MEDIDYLRENSIRQSSTIYVDSAKRNRILYPKSNHFEVKFNEPFRNVFSLQVLDASVPRTHYNVDESNNELYYLYSDENIERVIRLDIGDYTDVELIDAINIKFNGDILMSFLSSPSERRKQFRFTSYETFEMYPMKSSMSLTLGFGEGNSTTLTSQDDSEQYESHRIIDRLDASGLFVPITSSSTVFYQRFTAAETGIMSLLSFRISLNSQSDEDPTSLMNVFDMSVRIVSSTHNVATAKFSSDAITNGVVYITEWDIVESLNQGQQYFLILNVSDSDSLVNYNLKVDVVNSEADSLYFTEGVNSDINIASDLNSTNSITTYEYPESGITLNETYFGTIDDDTGGVNMGLIMQVQLSRHVWSIVPPGIYNLLGDRYIILRCKEIENHIMSSIKSYDSFNTSTHKIEEKQYETGIAKFKMSVVGFREERFDFNILPPQEFHPIGKLTNLTFFFENQDGVPYNFRGVNHTITIAINYFKPKRVPKEITQNSSMLYEPNLFTPDDLYDPNV